MPMLAYVANSGLVEKKRLKRMTCAGAMGMTEDVEFAGDFPLPVSILS